jgi:hypothetical protein
MRFVGLRDRKEISGFFEISWKEVKKGTEGPTESRIFARWAFDESRDLLEER